MWFSLSVIINDAANVRHVRHQTSEKTVLLVGHHCLLANTHIGSQCYSSILLGHQTSEKTVLLVGHHCLLTNTHIGSQCYSSILLGRKTPVSQCLIQNTASQKWLNLFYGKFNQDKSAGELAHTLISFSQPSRHHRTATVPIISNFHLMVGLCQKLLLPEF